MEFQGSKPVSRKTPGERHPLPVWRKHQRRLFRDASKVTSIKAISIPSVPVAAAPADAPAVCRRLCRLPQAALRCWDKKVQCVLRVLLDLI